MSTFETPLQFETLLADSPKVRWGVPKLGSLKKRALGFLTISLTLFPFQNCSKGFDSNSATVSSLCNAKIVAAVRAEKAGKIACDQGALYRCERRIFTPDAASSDSISEHCQGSFCVAVETRVFATGEARSPENAADFQPGGDYNREEVNCSHELRAEGLAVFSGAGSSVEEALKQAWLACKGTGE